jgi:hypothetical protein
LNDGTTVVQTKAFSKATVTIELKQRHSKRTKQEHRWARRNRAGETETKVDVKMEINAEANIEAEPVIQHALVSEADLNDADATFSPNDDLDGKVLELMNRVVELLKRKDVMREAIVEGDAKIKEAEDATDDWKLKVLGIAFASFEGDEIQQALSVRVSGRVNPAPLGPTQRFHDASMRIRLSRTTLLLKKIDHITRATRHLCAND